MRTKTANKLFSLLAAALMVISNISPVRVLAEGETPVVTWNGTEEAHVTVGEEIDFLAGVSATDGEGNELKVEIKGVTSDDESFAFEGQASLVATKAEVSYVVTYEALKDETPLEKGSKTFFVDKENEGNIEESTDPLSNTESQEETEETSEEQPQETPAVLGAKRVPILGAPNPTTGVDIQAYIIDDSGNQIDFSQGTSGTVANLSETISESGQARQHMQTQYSVSINISGLDPNTTDKRVEVSIPYGMEFYYQGGDATTDNAIKPNLNESKGDQSGTGSPKRGTSKVTLPRAVGNTSNYLNDTSAGTVTFYMKDTAEDLPLNMIMQIHQGYYIENVPNAIVVKVYDKDDNVLASTKLDKVNAKRFEFTDAGQSYHADGVTTVLDAEVNKSLAFYFDLSRQSGTFNSIATVNDWQQTVQLSDPDAVLVAADGGNFGMNIEEVLGANGEKIGKYIVTSSRRSGTHVTADLYNSSDIRPYLQIIMPSSKFNYTDKNTVVATVVTEFDAWNPYLTEGYTHIERTDSVTYTAVSPDNYSVSWVKDNPFNLERMVGETGKTEFLTPINTASINWLSLSGSESQKTIEMTFDSTNIGVQGVYIVKAPGEGDVEITFTSKNYPTATTKTVHQKLLYEVETRGTNMGSSSVPFNTTPSMGFVSNKLLGLDENDYLTSIKYDAKLSGTQHIGFPIVGKSLTKQDAIITVDIYNKGTNKQHASNVSGVVVSKASSLRHGDARTYEEHDEFVSAGNSIGLEYHIRSHINDYPTIIVVDSLVDENNNFLTFSNFKMVGMDIVNDSAPQGTFQWYDVPAAHIVEDDISGIGHIYKIDTSFLKTLSSYPFVGGYNIDKFGYIQGINQSRLRFTINTTPGTPEQSIEKEPAIYVVSSNESGQDKTAYSSGAGKLITFENIPEQILNYVNGQTVFTATNRGYKLYITPASDYSVVTSAKHETSEEYISWNVGDEAIAVGTKSSYDVKVDVINGSGYAITGPSYIYVPIPKTKDGTGWGSMLYDNKPFEFDAVLNRVDIGGKTGSLAAGSYKIEYGKVNATDDRTTLEGYAWRSSLTEVDDPNCVRITVQNLPKNDEGTTDVYSFILNCSVAGNVTQEELVDTFAPKYVKINPVTSSTIWENGSYLSLETALGEVRGGLFIDANKNGKYDDGEQFPEKDVPVRIYDKNDNEIGKKTTDASGEYLFVDLKTKDEYTIKVDNPDATAYEFTQLGTVNTKTSFKTDNQFTGNTNHTEGYSGPVYPKMAAVGKPTVSVYNIGLMDANAKTTFTFDANGGQFQAGTTSQTSVEVEGKSTDRVQAPANPEKAGYEFAGWDPQVPSTFGYEDKTFKAQWKVEEYTITYNLDGGTNHDDNPAKYTVEDTLIRLKNPTKEGHTFKQWTEGSEIAAGSTGNKTFTAEWTQNKYEVRYDTNGGSALDPKEVTWEEGNLKPTTDPTKLGYKVAKWWADAQRTIEYVSQTFKEIAVNVLSGSDALRHIYLYLDWEAKPYKVAYDTDGGDAIPERSVKWEDTNLQAASTPKKKGYTFEGTWYKDSAYTQPYNGEAYNVLVNNDDTVGTTTLYAKFIANEFTVEFNPNGGEGQMDKMDVTYGSGTTAPAVGFTRKGYDPDGWNTKSDGTGDAFAPGTGDISKLTDKDGKTVTLYAQWAIINYDINYVWNDDDPSVSKVTNKTDTTLFPATYTVEDAITLGTPIRDGYTFKGWKPSDKIEKGTTGELTFTAEWEVIEYKITYDLNKGTGSTDPVNATSNPATYTIEDEVTLADPTREGYTFKEWTPTNKIDKGSTGDKTFKAEWEANTYTISFSDEGADEGSAPADMNATFDTPLTAPDNTGNLKKKGHDFEGWEGPDGTIYKPGDELLNLTSGNGDTVTLKPVWESFTYSYTQGAGNVWTKGSNATSDFRVTRSRKDELTYGNFKEIKVDGVVVAASNYAASAGSVIVKLKPGYLQGLSNGNHTLETVLNDGSVSTTFTIKAKPQVNVVQPTARTCQDDGYPAGYYWNGTACVVGYGARVSTPNTGDGFNAWLYLSAGMTAMAIALFAALQLKKHTS